MTLTRTRIHAREELMKYAHIWMPVSMVVLLAGGFLYVDINQKTIHVPLATANRTDHTHKEWASDDWLIYLDTAGFGCGHVSHQPDGMYRADVVDWSGQGEPFAPRDFAKFEDAEALVERYCRP
jgi:hypothetical protein